MPSDPRVNDPAPPNGGDTTTSDWVGRAVRARVSPLAGLLVVGGGLVVSWLATYLLGGAGQVAPHWFYVPILVAAARFGLPGALVTSIASASSSDP